MHIQLSASFPERCRTRLGYEGILMRFCDGLGIGADFGGVVVSSRLVLTQRENG